MRRLSLLFPLLFSALWLSGCALVEREPSLPASIEARVGAPAPVKHALDYKEVCLLPVKADDKDPLLAAIRRGAENAGAKVTTLAPDAGTRACPFVLMWEVNARGRRVEAVRSSPLSGASPRAAPRSPERPKRDSRSTWSNSTRLPTSPICSARPAKPAETPSKRTPPSRRNKAANATIHPIQQTRSPSPC